MRPHTSISARSLAHLHAVVVVEELRRCGVEVFCVSPGARAIPLILALEENPGVVIKLFNDERSAAFWAQGAARGGVFPCLICTSGTAAANYLPAIIEASLAGTPLVVLTTDRPFELQYGKANQTIPQRELFTPFVAATFDIPAPECQLFLHALLADLDQAVFEARRTMRPVHLNMGYRKPFLEAGFTLEALPAEELNALKRWWGTERPYCDYVLPHIGLDAVGRQRLAERIAAAPHILCVAGPLLPTTPTTPLHGLARHLAAPLLADINSGMRCDGKRSHICALYNLYLRQALAQLPPADLVLYFGDRLVSEPLREYLEAQRGELIVCSSYPLRQDTVENEFIYPTMKVWGDPGEIAETLLASLPARPESALVKAFDVLESTAHEHLDTLLSPGPCGPLVEARVIHEIFRHSLDDSAVYLSASLIFREAEYFIPVLEKKLHVGANRGATGIDGVLSSGIGFGEGLREPCTVLIGDQAMLHDLNALAQVASASVPVYVIVINNQSGAIFHFFDLGDSGERLRNPHSWNFRGVAENFHLPYVLPSSHDDFVTAYQKAQAAQQSTLFEIIVDGKASVRLFQEAGRA